MKTVAKRAIAALAVVMLAFAAYGCREADRVSRNVSVEADNFNVARRITVFNVRTDKVLWQMTGTFSIKRSDGDLDVIVELPDHTYAKHFFDLNEWTTYIVEDLSGTNVPKYNYELNFLPETLVPVTITSND
jgi:hypothetical protein